MKLYKTTVLASTPNLGPPTTSWQGSQVEAGSVRAAAVSAGSKRKDVSTDQVDVPTDKEGLLAWLNANA